MRQGRVRGRGGGRGGGGGGGGVPARPPTCYRFHHCTNARPTHPTHHPLLPGHKNMAAVEAAFEHSAAQAADVRTKTTYALNKAEHLELKVR